MKTWFIDIDGTILEHRENKEIVGGCHEVLLPGSREFVNNRFIEDVVILTTARPKITTDITIKVLADFGILYDQIIFECGHRERIIVNDIKPVNAEDGGDRFEPFKTAYSLNVVRNMGLSKYKTYLMENK
jgi:hypothetical protein